MPLTPETLHSRLRLPQHRQSLTFHLLPPVTTDHAVNAGDSSFAFALHGTDRYAHAQHTPGEALLASPFP